MSEVEAVVSAVELEGLAEFARTVGEIFGRNVCGAAGIAAVVEDLGRSFHRDDGADQNGRREAAFFGDDIQAVIHSVGEIDVRVAAFPKHDLVAGRAADGGMAGRIIFADVTFHFVDFADDAAGSGFDHEIFSKEIRGHFKRGAKKELSRQAVGVFQLMRLINFSSRFNQDTAAAFYSEGKIVHINIQHGAIRYG